MEQSYLPRRRLLLRILWLHVTRLPFSLLLPAGEVVFTDPSTTILPMPVVAGKHLITGFKAEVVDSMNVSVPLDEVYNHHWLVFDQGV